MNFLKKSIVNTTFAIFASIGSISAMELQPVENEDVWIKTSDMQTITMPQWQIKQIEVLQTLSLQLEGPNCYHNPIDAPIASSSDLSLMQNAFNATNNPQKFDIFYDNLKVRRQERLLYVASKLKAAIINSSIEKRIWSSIKTPNTPIITSHAKEISSEPVTTKPKKNLNEPIVTLPSEEILNARLTEHEFTYYQELGTKLQNMTASVSDIIKEIDSILTNQPYRSTPFGIHYRQINECSIFNYHCMVMKRELIIRLMLQDNQNAIAFLEEEGLL